MFRIALSMLIVALPPTYLAYNQNISKGSVSSTSSIRLDGVYEFVSESTVLTKPKKIYYQRKFPQWSGVWAFQNGYYTRVLMNERRESFYHPKKIDDLGFESFAGPYEIEGERVWLRQPYALNPFNVGRSVLMSYRINKDTLTLIENLHPYLEDLREGTITTVLRRVK